MSAESQPQTESFEIERDRLLHTSQHSSSTFSLKFVFQMTTACGLFFAVFNYSPGLAIFSTLIIAPAIIRTVMIGDRRKRQGFSFNWDRQCRTMVGSIGVVMLTIGMAVGAFLAISLAFGVLGMLISMLVGSVSLSGDAAVVGTAGGMIWGFGGAVLAVGYSLLKLWYPKEDAAKQSVHITIDDSIGVE